MPILHFDILDLKGFVFTNVDQFVNGTEFFLWAERTGNS